MQKIPKQECTAEFKEQAAKRVKYGKSVVAQEVGLVEQTLRNWVKAFDVAVDLRRKSPTFLHWHAEHLGADNHRTLAIREGFAHGFHALTDDCELIDLHTAAYKPEAEAGLNALDPRIAIDWPRPVSEISAPDRQHALLDDGYSGIRVT